MKVRVPKLNPLIFSQTGEYNPYNDAALKEQLFGYVQPYAATDRITFQIQWDDIPLAQEVSIQIELINSSGVNILFYRTYTFTGITSGGTNYTNFYKQFLTSTGICGGYFVFDWLVSDISEIVTGGQYYFMFTLSFKDLEKEIVLTSNCFQLISDLSDTKLLKYTQSYFDGDGIYDTFISVMTRGFYMRVPCYFKQTQPILEKTVFKSNKTIELIDSNTNEKYILHIGGSNGIPDYLIENLKFIFAVDTKILDNVQYELTLDSEFSVEYIEKFNNRMLDIELQKSKNEYVKGYEQFVNYNVTTTTTTTTEQRYNSLADIGLMVASVEINHYGSWRIVPVTANALNEVTFSQITGTSKTIITAKVRKMENSGAAKTYTFQVNDLITDTKVQNIVITKPAITTGIGYGIIGDNLVIGLTKI